MSKKMKGFTARASVIAVQGALISMVAAPLAYADNTAAELTRRANTVEVGVGHVDTDSYKFGEFNGLEQKGAYLNGAFDVNGGGDGSATGFRIKGSDLGLDTRNLSAEFGEQGKFRINFGYDELTRRGSDSYMTPYIGAGTGNLTLPANWATNARNCTVSGVGGVVGAVVGTAGCGNYHVTGVTTAGTSTATPAGNAAALTAAELGDFQHVNLQTKRQKFDFGLSLDLNPNWKLSGSARRTEKDGIQAIGAVAYGAAANQVTLPNPIKYVTNEFNLKLAHNGNNYFAEGAYYGSIFKDGIDGLNFQDPYFSSATPSISSAGAVTFPFPDAGRLGTMPGNQLHQLNLTGGYNFSRTTKLVANASYGRNTQNEGFLPYSTGLNLALPINSLGGLVVTKSVNLKLTARPVRNVNLSAAYKFDERDNRTPSTRLSVPDVNPQEPQILGALGTKYNLPYSRKVNQFNLDADWTFMKSQVLKAGLENQKLNRWCNGLPAVAEALPPLMDNCVNATSTSENTLRLQYRNNVLDNVTGRIGYDRSSRNASSYGRSFGFYNADLLTRFHMTDRERDKLRSSVTWQATDAFELTAGYDWNKDRYSLGRNVRGFNDLGLDSTKSTVINLDAAYRVSDKVSLNGFYTEEDISSFQKGNGVNPATPFIVNPLANWTAEGKDKVRTFGLGAKAAELMAGKLDLGADYTNSRAASPYALAVSSNLAMNAAAVTANAPVGFPDTFSNSQMLRLTAKYKLDKTSALGFLFGFQKLSSSDPARYNGLQQGAATAQVTGTATNAVNGAAVGAANVVPVSSLIPTNEQAPNYSVRVIAVTYIYTFH